MTFSYAVGCRRLPGIVKNIVFNKSIEFYSPNRFGFLGFQWIEEQNEEYNACESVFHGYNFLFKVFPGLNPF